MTIRVAILLVPEYSAICYAGAYEPFRKAKELLKHTRIETALLSLSGTSVADCEGRRIEADAPFTDRGEPFDAIIVVASFNILRYWTPEIGAFLRRNHQRGSIIASADIGTWFLAKAGLLNNRRATIHWDDSDAFSAMFPDVQLGAEGYIVDGRIVTASSGTAMLSAAIEMIETLCGLPVATEIAHMFNIVDRNANYIRQQNALIQRLSKLNPSLATATRLMQENIEIPLSIATLAERTGVSQRTLHSIFHKYTHKSPQAFYLEERLTLARKLVVATNKRITDIAYCCGFSSINSFARAYCAAFGISATKSRDARGFDPETTERYPPS